MAYFNQPNYYNQAILNQQRLAQAQMEQLYPQFGQQIMPQPQQQGISGRIIDDISTVNANEIPMDGSVGIFIKRDMSSLYTKQWCNDGTIRTIEYKPISDSLNTKANTLSNEDEKCKEDSKYLTTDVFQEHIATLENKLDVICKNISPKATTSRTKKEVEE